MIKLAFYSLLFLILVTMIAGPWVALAAFIAVVIYGVTDTARKARELKQAHLVIAAQLNPP